MSNVVKSHLVRIGNSRGVRIPKVFLEQLDLTDEVELAIQADQLVIRSAHGPRQGWESRFQAMHEAGEDRMVENLPASTWDNEEWEW